MEPSIPFFCAITGATATGKTELALALAERMECDVVAVDAMQVYEGLDIGTAKPTPAQRERVRHHGLDLVSPLETFNAHHYCQAVEPVLEEAWRRKTQLILCGGTGLYFRALLEGFFEAPDADPALRQELKERCRAEGCEALYAELAAQDPETAASIHPHDARRILRALEIMKQTGETVSALKKRQIQKPWGQVTRFIGLRRESEDLAERINLRTKRMYREGLVEETEHLIRMGCTLEHTALQGLGYRQCYGYLTGQTSLEEAEERTIHATRQYARRQKTWFRHQFPTDWLDISATKDFMEYLNKSLQVWLKHGNNSRIDGKCRHAGEKGFIPGVTDY